MYAYPMARPLRTPNGLRWTLYAFYGYFAVLGLMLLQSLVTAAILGSLGPGATINAFLSAMAAMVVLTFAVFILSIIVLSLYLVGFGFLYGGRNEFGAAHAANVRIALFTLIAAVVAELVGVFASVILSMRAVFGGFVGGIDIGAIYAIELAAIATGIVVAVLAAATLVLAVRALARPEHHTMLLIAAAIGIATPAVLGGLALWLMPGILSFVSTTDVTMGLPSLIAAALGFVTFALFLVAYRGAAQRIQSGELPPVMPPSVSAPWIPAPIAPPYPYPYPVPGAPPPPPPQTPGQPPAQP